MILGITIALLQGGMLLLHLLHILFNRLLSTEYRKHISHFFCCSSERDLEGKRVMYFSQSG